MQNIKITDYVVKNKKLLIGVFAMLILTLIAVVVTSTLSNSVQSPGRQGNAITIVDPETGSKMTFGRDGLVIIEDANGSVRTEVWDRDKIAAFLAYINQTYGESDSYSIGFDSDELISTISEGGTTSPTQNPISQYFPSPTPPAGSGSPGGGNPGGGGPGPTDVPGAPSWCKHWKLSYCADVEENDPTPFPSYPPGVIVAQNCEEWRAANVGYNTIISNFSCVEATPSP